MEFQDLKQIHVIGGLNNRNTKYIRPPSASSTKSNVTEQFNPSINFIQVTASRTPRLKLCWIIPAVLFCLTAVIVIVVCLVLFVGNNKEQPPTYPPTTQSNKESATRVGMISTTKTSKSTTINPITISSADQTESTTKTTLSKATTSTSTSTTTSSSPGVGTWGNWGSWTMCAVTCGDSVHSRYRTCVKSLVTDTDCAGEFKEQETCTTTTCPVYGIWTTWESWTDCDKTCDGGSQTRLRTCTKSQNTVIDCVGRSSQQQTCNEWACPDCSRVCVTGTLNSACDACECTGQTTKGLVINHLGAPLQNVSIHHNSAPHKSLTTTKENGTFEIDILCNQQEIKLQANGYQDIIATVSSSSITVTMQLIEYPVITQQPKSHLRLNGESVVFCCNATGNPMINSYEWLRNGIVLDESLYPDGNMLTITNLKFEDSGSLICRANSPAGAVFSDIVSLTVRDTPNDFCLDAYGPLEIDLPSDCIQSNTNTSKFNIGQCSPKSCRRNDTNGEQNCSIDKRSCCIPATYESRIVQCSGYSISVYVTTSCMCGECESSDITVKGKALGLNSGLPLRFGSIVMNGNNIATTGLLGDFSFTVPLGTTRIPITFKDTIFKQFLDTMKIIKMDEETFGTFYINVRMIEKSPAIDIDPTLPNTIQLGNESGANSIASVTIPANAIYYPNGSRYDGTVKASINFFDPRNSSSIQNSPGEFSYIDQEGQSQNLQSFGVFSVTLQDQSGSSLQVAGEAEISLDAKVFEATSLGNLSDAKLWGLNPDTGLWEETGQLNLVTSRRRKRQANSFLVGSTPVSAYKWINFDVPILFRKKCYFKAKAYDGNTAITGYKVRTIHTSIPGSIYGVAGQVAMFKEDFIGNDKPILAACGRFSTFSGYIETEQNGEKLIVDMTNTGMDTNTMNSINYQVTQDSRTVSADFNSASDGPFYERYRSVYNSYFRFLYQTPTNNFIFTALDKPFIVAYRIYQTEGDVLWYPPLNSIPVMKFKTCYFKVGTENANGNLKFRITSQNDDGQILGIREKKLTRGAACIEYKCSGPNPDFTKTPVGNDFVRSMSFTLINVSPIGQLCTVINESSAIREKEKTNLVLGTARSNIGDTLYTANIPETQDQGVYFQDTSDYTNLGEIRSSTIKECYGGVPDSSKDEMDPNNGLAVKFRCL